MGRIRDRNAGCETADCGAVDGAAGTVRTAGRHEIDAAAPGVSVPAAGRKAGKREKGSLLRRRAVRRTEFLPSPARQSAAPGPCASASYESKILICVYGSGNSFMNRKHSSGVDRIPLSLQIRRRIPVSSFAFGLGSSYAFP